MVALYELTDTYRELMLLVSSGETTEEEIATKLKGIIDNFQMKVEQIGYIVIDSNADIDAIKAEEMRLAQRRKSLENRVEWLKKYLMGEMIACQQLKVKARYVTVAVRDSPMSVEVVKMEDIPSSYCRTIPARLEPDKKAIIDHFKQSGEIVAGTNIVTDKKYLSIT